ncbi:MAG: hypothetical protein K2K51_05575, partial [Bacteroidales bacterium]|nr:hypothetical protein [Bacteroidales bacterium]
FRQRQISYSQCEKYVRSLRSHTQRILHRNNLQNKFCACFASVCYGLKPLFSHCVLGSPLRSIFTIFAPVLEKVVRLGLIPFKLLVQNCFVPIGDIVRFACGGMDVLLKQPLANPSEFS